ncbi:MAG: hypothetical protein M1582_05140, partial [Actinobacteria bacterium]|nr:hypothetical protein [Actinomycetota bacterium]
AIVESGNNAAAMGDDGRAAGRWQQHPAWFAQWYPATLGDTWDVAFARAVQRYLRAEAAEGRTVFQALALFHLGHDPRTHGDVVAAMSYAEQYYPSSRLDEVLGVGNMTFEDFYAYASAA